VDSPRGRTRHRRRPEEVCRSTGQSGDADAPPPQLAEALQHSHVPARHLRVLVHPTFDQRQPGPVTRALRQLLEEEMRSAARPYLA
jgi:hypothetical protein